MFSNTRPGKYRNTNNLYHILLITLCAGCDATQPPPAPSSSQERSLFLETISASVREEADDYIRKLERESQQIESRQ